MKRYLRSSGAGQSGDKGDSSVQATPINYSLSGTFDTVNFPPEAIGPGPFDNRLFTIDWTVPIPHYPMTRSVLGIRGCDAINFWNRDIPAVGGLGRLAHLNQLRAWWV